MRIFSCPSHFVVALVVLISLFPPQPVQAADRDGTQVEPLFGGFGMGMLSINLIESVRKLGPIRGYHPELAPVVNPDPAPEMVADGKPSS